MTRSRWDIADLSDHFMPPINQQAIDQVVKKIAQNTDDYLRPRLKQAVEQGFDLAYLEFMAQADAWRIPVTSKIERADINVYRSSVAIPAGDPPPPLPPGAPQGVQWRICRVRDLSPEQVNLILNPL